MKESIDDLQCDEVQVVKVEKPAKDVSKFRAVMPWEEVAYFRSLDREARRLIFSEYYKK